MFEKELQKLKREELLQIMLAQSREIDSLTEQLEQEKAKNVNDEAESGVCWRMMVFRRKSEH